MAATVWPASTLRSITTPSIGARITVRSKSASAWVKRCLTAPDLGFGMGHAGSRDGELAFVSPTRASCEATRAEAAAACDSASRRRREHRRRHFPSPSHSFVRTFFRSSLRWVFSIITSLRFVFASAWHVRPWPCSRQLRRSDLPSAIRTASFATSTSARVCSLGGEKLRI